jgi:hypothetical protein
MTNRRSFANQQVPGLVGGQITNVGRRTHARARPPHWVTLGFANGQARSCVYLGIAFPRGVEAANSCQVAAPGGTA